MDDIKPRGTRRTEVKRPVFRHAVHPSRRQPESKKPHNYIPKMPSSQLLIPHPDFADLVRQPRKRLKSLKLKNIRKAASSIINNEYLPAKIMALTFAIIIFTSLLISTLQPRNLQDRYSLQKVEGILLDDPRQNYADALKPDAKSGDLKFNEGYSPGVDVAGQSASPKITANFGGAPDNKVTVNDPVNQVGVTFKPKFNVEEPQKNQNRAVYPIKGKNAAQVYTMKGTAVKEDILLYSYSKDKLDFTYEVELSDGLEIRFEDDGSLAVYGPGEESLLGNVSTASENDAGLLKKARDSAEKTKLIFKIPAPFILEPGKKTSSAKAWYTLDKNEVTIHATGLKEAKYPLSIDPSVYVETATKLMRGNNESNLDFDVDNELIQKGKLTGGRFDAWTSTLSLPAARWNHATAVAGGKIYVTGGNDGSANQSTVYWSEFNTTTKALQSPNPGAGACTNWCTNSAYNLPANRAGHSMVAYNGFLYVLGGESTTNTPTNTVYIAKLGANGEPSLWHPTDTNKNNWVYWYTSTTTLSSARTYTSVAAYNNRLYLAGGLTAAPTTDVTTMEYTDIAPTGDIGSWSTSGMTALLSARHKHTMQIYNDRIYIIGGRTGTTMKNTVEQVKLNSSGTFNGTWNGTTGFTTARMSAGGNFSTIWGGYIYISGGCTAANANDYCTTIAGDTQLASINADGTVTDWTTVTGVTSNGTGHGFVGWRNTLYHVGGCTAMNTTTGACTTTISTVQYGNINPDGDVSTVSNSVPNGTAPCASATFYDCDMPPEGNGSGEGGRMSGGAVVNNGFIYYMGGCTAVGSNSVCYTGNAGKTSDTISYASIASDGTLVRVASCTGGTLTFVGSWCVDNTNTINGSSGLAAFGYTVFNNVIYAVGGTTGTDWQANVWRNPLNANGSLGTWSSQTFANLDLGNAKGYQYVFSRANPTSAGTYPGNLYVLGGCSGVTAADSGLDCTGSMYTEVYKCNITTTGALEEADANDCTTSGQLQIDSEPGTGGNQGLGVMAGTVYANYIYLIGGQSPNQSERGSIMYAKLDNSNNIVDADGETITDNIWETSASSISPVRRRGVAFGYNGYLYALAGYASGTSLNDLLFAKIDVSNGSIGNFSTSLVTVNPRWDLRAIVNNGYVYTFGGCSVGTPPASCTTMTGTLQTFQLYNNYSGSPASYSASSNLFTTDRIGASSAVLNGYIYIAGGCTSATDCTTASTNVQYALLNADGTIGTWANTTNVLPLARTFGQLETAGGSLYYIGGQDSTSTNEYSTVYYATPVSGNITSAWGTATNALPAVRTQHSAAVWNNRIYVTGGLDSSSAATSTVYISPQLNSGGDITSAWTSGTGFNVARSGTTAVAYANNLYIFGGYTGTQYLNDSQYTQINSDGTLDSWNYSTSLPGKLRQADGFAANGFMYLFGGRSADTTCDSNTIVAPISANTTIATGNNPTGIGEWFETNVKYNGGRYGAAAAYNEGRAYLLGGGCGSTLTYTGTDRIVQTTLQSQPQIAKYSRMIDTDTDVFPTRWLMNGLDNDIGARWMMKYRTMTNTTTSCTSPAMTTWGQETNYGAISLGTPATYTPINGSGVNTNCARYYYFSVNIDSSQSFGYPEDVQRGPTIADLTLFFTSDPSKRLRHGKTFTGGEQQPLDTPFTISSTAGPLSGATFANDLSIGTVNWLNTANVASSDNSYATVALNGTTSRYLKATNFGFSIPAGATILGIKVEPELKQASAGGGAYPANIRLVKGNTIQGNTQSSGFFLTTTDTYLSFGGASDLWGLTFTPSDINASNFGVALAMGDDGSASTTSLDHIRITVTYTQ